MLIYPYLLQLIELWFLKEGLSPGYSFYLDKNTRFDCYTENVSNSCISRPSSGDYHRAPLCSRNFEPNSFSNRRRFIVLIPHSLELVEINVVTLKSVMTDHISKKNVIINRCRIISS